MSENLLDRVTLNPDICHGKPTIREMRYPVELILELLAAGMSHQEISDATGMPLGTVKTHARRGILQVREHLGLGSTQLSKEVKA